MLRRLLILCTFLAAGITGFAQATPNLASVDSVTYAAWLRADWNRLIDAGNQALAQGIDFYYLRVRMGIAWYEKGNDHQAIRHFEIAFVANPDDVFVQESLYLAYLNAGRLSEARVLSASFSAELKAKTGAGTPKFLRRADVFLNGNLADNSESIDRYSGVSIPAGDGAQFISRKHAYVFLGLQHELSPRLSLYHAFSGLDKEHFVFFRENGTETTQPRQEIKLAQYFATANVRAAKNLDVWAGGHYVHIRFPEQVTVVRQGRPVVLNVIRTEGDYLAFAGAYKHFRLLTLGAAFYYGTLNGNRQYQKDLKLIVYPLGNRNLYATTLLIQQTETAPGFPVRNTFLADQQLGVKLSNRVWAEAYATFGDMANLAMNDGAVVFNGLETIRQRYGARLLIFPSFRWNVTLDGTYFQQESAFFGENTYNVLSFPSYSITVGLSWNF